MTSNVLKCNFPFLLPVHTYIVVSRCPFADGLKLLCRLYGSPVLCLCEHVCVFVQMHKRDPPNNFVCVLLKVAHDIAFRLRNANLSILHVWDLPYGGSAITYATTSFDDILQKGKRSLYALSCDYLKLLHPPPRLFCFMAGSLPSPPFHPHPLYPFFPNPGYCPLYR